MKLLSIAVPCYNSSMYMEKCINSCLSCKDDIEIIIVNDGSTKDNTKQIADNYAKLYPNTVRAIHKENGGHGSAVNEGIKNATGKYFKVVDSDDWVEETALCQVIDTLREFDEENSPDCMVVNYVYEYAKNNTQRFIRYRREFPQDKIFDFEQSKRFSAGKFLTMHSLIYKLDVLKMSKLQLPEHTFYVDNLYICLPLIYAKTFYYLNVDLYRYFIGRDDQSVNENVIMERIDQHISVTDKLVDSLDFNDVKRKRKKLYKYLISHLAIMMTINSIYLIKTGTKESYEKKKTLWGRLKSVDPISYKKCRRRFTGIVSSNSRFMCLVSKSGYVIARKIFKFN